VRTLIPVVFRQLRAQHEADFLMPDSFISSTSAGWRLAHSYAALPPLFHQQTQPGAVRAPHLVVFNTPLALSLGLNPETLAQTGSAALFAGNVLPEGAHPIAQAYAGHQFGHFTTLGDGRAILLGEQITPVGERFDIQLKGAGLTPFSRGGDGRAALGPMLREYLISEAMHALGIPTTRSLAVALTGEPVLRRQRLDGAVLTRVAASHLRVGTFEWAAAQRDPTALRALASYSIHRHYPDLAEAPNPYLEFLEAVMERQASLIAQWLQVGFIHGVMNTDNMALSGETIDYGPCAFMDAYDPATVFSSIDQQGRYAYGNQPLMAQWNLARLAETLLPLLHDDEAQAIELANAAIQSFKDRYEHHRLSGMRKKLGLFTEEADDSALMEDLLKWMQDHQADFTNTFRDLSAGTPLPEDVADQADFSSWHQRWSARRSRQSQSVAESQRLMQAHNPAFIPRNHKVEEALAAAVEHRDFSVLQRLLGVLAKPFDYAADQPGYQTPPATAACAYQTFCGT